MSDLNTADSVLCFHCEQPIVYWGGYQEWRHVGGGRECNYLCGCECHADQPPEPPIGTLQRAGLCLVAVVIVASWYVDKGLWP